MQGSSLGLANSLVPQLSYFIAPFRKEVILQSRNTTQELLDEQKLTEKPGGHAEEVTGQISNALQLLQGTGILNVLARFS